MSKLIKTYELFPLSCKIAQPEVSCSYVNGFIRGAERVRKGANISNRYNQVPHLNQDTTWGSNKITHHKQEPRGQPFPSR